MDTQGIRVFVYGSLKQGHGNNVALRTADFLGRCVLTGNYSLLDLGWYPGLVVDTSPDAPSRKVLGEVYRVSRDTLDGLDLIEGHPNYYARHKVRTPFKGAWCYFLPFEYRNHRPAVEETHGVQVWRPTIEEVEYVSATP